MLQGFVGLWEAAWMSSKWDSISSPKAAKGRLAAGGRLTQPLAKRPGNVPELRVASLCLALLPAALEGKLSCRPPFHPRLLKIRVNRKTVGGAFLCPWTPIHLGTPSLQLPGGSLCCGLGGWCHVSSWGGSETGLSGGRGDPRQIWRGCLGGRGTLGNPSLAPKVASRAICPGNTSPPHFPFCT